MKLYNILYNYYETLFFRLHWDTSILQINKLLANICTLLPTYLQIYKFNITNLKIE